MMDGGRMVDEGSAERIFSADAGDRTREFLARIV
jgi:ABC-type polar amino acid transport system ATPase subunit